MEDHKITEEKQTSDRRNHLVRGVGRVKMQAWKARREMKKVTTLRSEGW